jgi:hypothetical protein
MFSSVTVFRNKEGQEIAAMLDRIGGDIEDHGRELAEFLKDILLCKSYPKNGPFAQGMGCLAAQVITYFRNRYGGNISLVPVPVPLSRNWPWECIYMVLEEEGAARPIVEVRFPGRAAPHFRGTAVEVVEWINMIEKGFLDKERAVVRVAAPYAAIDFDDRYPYLRSVEDKLDSERGQGSAMSKAMWDEFSNMHLDDRYIDPTIIACIGEEDDLELRIRQASDFAWVPSDILWFDGMRIVFWAVKWDHSLWNKHNASFTELPVREIILKRIGEDPVDLESRGPLEYRSDRLYTLFNATAQRDGYEVP